MGRASQINRRNLAFLACLFLLLAGAIALRWPRLDLRPMHCDESVHAVKFAGLLDRGEYRYDPHEYHGPTLYYAALPVARLAGESRSDALRESTLRLTPVLFGVAWLALLLLVADGLGRGAVLGTIALAAVSPAMVYYSRYFIHEMLLVFFTLLAIGAGWRWWRSRRAGWALLSGLGVGLMHATKETFVFNMAAALAALAVAWAWQRWEQGRSPSTEPPPPSHQPSAAGGLSGRDLPHLALAVAAAVLISITLFSSFFANASGPLDSLLTYLPWASRAGGASPHNHGWTFYFERLFWFHTGRGPVWTEGFVGLLAVLGALAILRPGWIRGRDTANESAGASGLLRFLLAYTFFLTAGYTLLSYKTPWCELGFWQGMLMLAGVGVATLWQRWTSRAARGVVTLLLAAGLAHLAWQAWVLNQDEELCANPRNPCVYAHTLPDVLNLVETVQALAAVHPEGRRLPAHVVAEGGDYWPLPWYLRGLPNLGWWDKMPEGAPAPVVITSMPLANEIQKRLGPGYELAGSYGLRPKVFLTLYVRTDLWKKHLEARQR